MGRVSRWDDIAGGGERRALIPAVSDSMLALDALQLAPGASEEIADDVHDTLLFVHAGACALAGDELGGAGSLFVPAGDHRTVVARSEGASVVRAMLGADTDLHAPMGPAEPVVGLEHVEPGKATGARSFQVLHGPHNGSTRATMFVGYIPPGKAPWHYHLYDEIVWVLRGEGRLHIGDTVEALEHGAAFRLRPREVHIVENTDPAVELAVVGIFTPAGSPSAAYLMPDVAATYAIG